MSGRDEALRRLVGRTGPRDPDLQRAWARRSAQEQGRLRRVATDPDAARHLDDDLATALVDALAEDRVRRRRWDIVAPVVTALLVLSTVWGFGRAAVPDLADTFLLVGLAAGAVTIVVGWRRGATARQRARAVRRVLRRP